MDLQVLISLCFQNVLDIRRDVFGENNLCVAMVHEDLGYASYVNEYSSGKFENARYGKCTTLTVICFVLTGYSRL